jgi:hypothetical protein
MATQVGEQIRWASAASASIWLTGGTASRTGVAATAGAADGAGGPDADSVSTHRAASTDAASGARTRSRRRTASTAAAVRNTSTSTAIGPSAALDAKGAGPRPTLAAHGVHAPPIRALSSKRTLNGAVLRALKDGTKCVAPAAGQSGAAINASSPCTLTAKGRTASRTRRHPGGIASASVAGASPEVTPQRPAVTMAPLAKSSPKPGKKVL